MKKIVILSTRPPYGSVVNAEAFRMAMGLAFSEFAVDLVLVGNGVYAALKGQHPEALGLKPMTEAYASISQFKINLFIDAASLAERQLAADILVAAPIIDGKEISAKINTADAVFTF
jgi:tRNA 2-thiouridine synthesizing protein C